MPKRAYFASGRHFPLTISIIIVSYNVKYFLEQCLYSVMQAVSAIDAEIFVVDNASFDDSIAYLRPRFPGVRFIANSENKGFARANNQALALATGQYILFLNPDTIVADDTLEKSIAFLAAAKTAGAVGVRMIDGAGHYLPESKRGFPSLWTAFCKLSGMTALFPSSRLFANYYLGHLSPAASQEIDVVSGAFFLVEKKVLGQTGSYDEQFFMYAEDIDLSYRIQQSGYLNYFFAGTTIIHFKGESTRKDLQHVRLFYRAMYQFVRKHAGSSWLYAFLIRIAIDVRSLPAFLRGLFPPSQEKPANAKRILVRGDTQWAEQLDRMLAGEKEELATRLEDATTVIFAEGPAYSFRQIVGEWEQRSQPGFSRMISASGSGSAVGSRSSKISGEVISF